MSFDDILRARLCQLEQSELERRENGLAYLALVAGIHKYVEPDLHDINELFLGIVQSGLVHTHLAYSVEHTNPKGICVPDGLKIRVAGQCNASLSLSVVDPHRTGKMAYKLIVSDELGYKPSELLTIDVSDGPAKAVKAFYKVLMLWLVPSPGTGSPKRFWRAELAAAGGPL